MIVAISKEPVVAPTKLTGANIIEVDELASNSFCGMLNSL
jgi:hypothetical protein